MKNNDEINENLVSWKYEAWYSLQNIISECLFSLLFIKIFVEIQNIFVRIVLSIFIILGIISLVIGIIRLLKSINVIKGMISKKDSADGVFKVHTKLNMADKAFLKIYAIIFLTFLFGVLIVIDYTLIKSGDFFTFLVTLWLWFYGIVRAFKYFKK